MHTLGSVSACVPNKVLICSTCPCPGLSSVTCSLCTPQLRQGAGLHVEELGSDNSSEEGTCPAETSSGLLSLLSLS